MRSPLLLCHQVTAQRLASRYHEAEEMVTMLPNFLLLLYILRF